MRQILVLSPHTDDVELGAGGLVFDELCKGAFVQHHIFSTARDVNGQTDYDIRQECINANTLIANKAGVYYDDETKDPENNEKCLYCEFDNLVAGLLDAKAVRDRLHPLSLDHWDMVVIPATFDVHQDHQVVSQEAVRVFKGKTSIIGYYDPWNAINRHTLNVFHSLSRHSLDVKIMALDCYKSQQFRPFTTSLSVEALAQTAGLMCGVQYAEAFECIQIRI